MIVNIDVADAHYSIVVKMLAVMILFFNQKLWLKPCNHEYQPTEGSLKDDQTFTFLSSSVPKFHPQRNPQTHLKVNNMGVHSVMWMYIPIIALDGLINYIVALFTLVRLAMQPAM